MARINWYTVFAIVITLGGLAIAVELWRNGAENYSSDSLRGMTFTWILQGIAGLIGSKATAVFIAGLMVGFGYLIFKLGQMRRP
jgi:hypothetical protein